MKGLQRPDLWRSLAMVCPHPCCQGYIWSEIRGMCVRTFRVKWYFYIISSRFNYSVNEAIINTINEGVGCGCGYDKKYLPSIIHYNFLLSDSDQNKSLFIPSVFSVFWFWLNIFSLFLQSSPLLSHIDLKRKEKSTKYVSVGAPANFS